MKHLRLPFLIATAFTFAACASTSAQRGPSSVESASLPLKLACKAAAAGMPNGNGASVYYPNGRTLTTSAGKAGASWYHQNGRTLTTSVSVPGASYYYANGRTFSSSTGKAGASWYYEDGRTITSSAPELSPKEMAELACDMILSGADE